VICERAFDLKERGWLSSAVQSWLRIRSPMRGKAAVRVAVENQISRER
jgi:hypothetical protein